MMMTLFWLLFKGEVGKGWPVIADALSQAAFFVMIAVLFPLAVGPAPDRLAELAGALIWIAALLSAIPAFDRLFIEDMRSGWCEQLLSYGTPLWLYIYAKLAGWFVLSILPLIGILPFLSIMMGLSLASLPVLALSLSVGVFAMLLLGGLAAGLSMGARRSAMLLSVLILPLMLPVLIFGVMAVEASIAGQSAWPHIKLLLALCLFFAVICPPATQFALKSAIEER